MNRNIRNWLLSAALAGALATGAGLAMAQTQQPQEPNEPKPGTRTDRKEDNQEAGQLRQQIQQDRQKLQADLKQFGKDSPQVKADREQLRRDKQARYRLQGDTRRDQRRANRRRYHHGRRG